MGKLTYSYYYLQGQLLLLLLLFLLPPAATTTTTTTTTNKMLIENAHRNVRTTWHLSFSKYMDGGGECGLNETPGYMHQPTLHKTKIGLKFVE